MNNSRAAYYNEIDPYAAQWLRNLISEGHIAPGDVDERSIEDVHPDDLRKYTQCHFFAGIGVWSYALRRAGWPDDRPVWTGSCPCQPFSSAGKGAGFDDERHLWPAWQWLIQECRPPVIFGEQVASKAVEPWIDLVHADLEAMDYAFGAVPFPSAGIGAPHIRDRNFWMAHSNRQQYNRTGTRGAGRGAQYPNGGSINRLANMHRDGRGEAGKCQPTSGRDGVIRDSAVSRMVDAPYVHSEQRTNIGTMGETEREMQSETQREGDGPTIGAASSVHKERPGPINGFWRDADWLLCRDGKWRPVEPGTFPLAHGATSRVGRLRAYGNAINAEAAKIFIESVMEAV